MLSLLTLSACVFNSAPGKKAWNQVSRTEVFADLSWNFEDGLENHQISRFSPPTVVDGLVFMTVDPDHREWDHSGSTPRPYLIAIEEATGKIRWKTEMDGIGLIDSPPSVHDGVVLARTLGNMDPNHDVHAFDASTGTVLWTLENTFPAARTWIGGEFCTLILKDNQAGETLQELDDLCVNERSGAVISKYMLVGQNGWWAAASGVTADADTGVLYLFQDARLTALDLSRGAQKFQSSLPGGAYALAARDGMVFVNDDFVTAFDGQTGQERWRLSRQVGRAQIMLPSGDNKLLIVPDPKLPPALLALDDRTGAIQWSFEPGAEKGQAYPPQVIGETVYIAFGDGTALQSKYLPDFGNQGARYLFALDRPSGKVKWQYEQPDFSQDQYNQSRITLPVAELNGVVYATAWLSSGGDNYSSVHASTLFRLNAASGKVLSTTTLMLTSGGGSYSPIGNLLTGAYAVNGRVYLPTGANHVYALK